MSKKTEFTTDEIFRKIDTSLEQTDRLRADNLDKMAVVQQIRTKALVKERQRLAVKYGADDRRVQRIDAQLQFTQGFTRDLKVEVDKAKIQVPTIDRNSWMVHGRVLQAKDNQGIPKLTVSLVNSEGQWVQELGYDCTNERGYFAIIYSPKDSQSPTPQESIFLRVSDANQQILYRSNEPLQVELGESIYREIFLSEEKECTPPPNSATPSVPVQILSLEGSTQLTVNQSGRFTARVNQDATPPITYSWNFGDKITASTLTATHSYANAGTYNVTLTASNAGGSDSRSLSVIVSQSSSDVWKVRGRVVNEQKQGLEGLVVSLFDRDCIFDDRLGTTQTDENGGFIFNYRTQDFRNLFEAQPDLYLKIMDRQGNILYSSESAVRCQAGREEVFEICIQERDRAS